MLPPTLTSFVDRVAERAALAEALATYRLVTAASTWCTGWWNAWSGCSPAGRGWSCSLPLADRSGQPALVGFATWSGRSRRAPSR
jgi:hypothetical protein